jgi:hypothetical protein
VTAVRVPWSGASFLAYPGGITILAAILALLGVQSGEHGAGGLGILQTAAHFAGKWSSFSDLFLFPLFPFVALAGFDGDGERHAHEWAGPVAFVVSGLVFIGIAIVLVRRSRPPLAEI